MSLRPTDPEPLQAYLDHRRRLAERWARRAGSVTPTWAAWPDGHLFLIAVLN